MLVVADTTPLNYLILIGYIDVLHTLYGHIVIPPAVYKELRHEKSPPPVRAWAEAIPGWVEIRIPSSIAFTFQVKLGAGEQEAISLAQTDGASFLLIDEIRGRREARRLGIPVAGTLGILQQAHREGRLEIRTAIQLLQQSSFQATPSLFERTIFYAERDEES
jgi:predicted nucleic acid-binding protein